MSQQERDIESVGEESLAASVKATRSDYRAIVERIPAITYTEVLSESPATTYISPQVEALLGVTPGEWIADPGLWFALLHPEDRAPTRQLWLESVAGRHPYDVGYRVRRRDGEYRWFKTRGVPIRDGAGRIVKWFGTCTDITDGKSAEPLLILLRRFATESAREEARMFCEELVAQEFVAPIQHDDLIAA